MSNIFNKINLSKHELDMLKKILTENSILDIYYNNNTIFITLTNDKNLILKNATYSLYEAFFELFNINFNDTPRKKKTINATVWSDSEIDFLKQSFDTLSVEDIAIELRRSPYQIQTQAMKLRLFNINNWSEAELNYLRTNITLSNTELACSLNRSLGSIKSKKRVIRLQLEKEGNPE